jgi:hypothetical protein
MIVQLSCTVDELRPRLSGIDGARLVRELPPDSAVVVLARPADATALAQLPGVVSVQPDPFEHPTRGRD